MYAKAIFVEGKVVTGRHHGEAFSLLTEDEKNCPSLLSGFWDEKTGRFFSEDREFYTKKMYLVRHSKPSRGYDEDPDPDLSQDGIECALKTARYLKKKDLSYFQGFTSPLKRCLITAEIISRETGISFEVDPIFAELTDNYPLDVVSHAQDFPQFRWPTGNWFRIEKEKPMEFADRLGRAIRELPAESVVVSHCSVIAHMAQVAAGTKCCPIALIPPASITFIDNQDLVHLGMQV